MGNKFENNGGDQNNALGDHAIGKQVNIEGVPPETLIAYAEEFGVTKSALISFFKILEQEQVPLGDLDSKLREIACRHKELLLRFESVQSDDPEVRILKAQAKSAIEDGRFAEAEGLLAQARERDRLAVGRMKSAIAEQQAALEKRQLSEAESCVKQAKLQEMQYRYIKAAEFWQEAAGALPEGYQLKRAFYINQAGYDFHHIASYAVALPLFEHSLMIYNDIGYRKGQLAALNNISGIHWEQGNYITALDYQKNILGIQQKIGNWKGQGVTLNNISQIYNAWGDSAKAMKYLEQSLLTSRKTGDKGGERVALHNIGGIYYAQGHYAFALKCLKQSLMISCRFKDKIMKGRTLCSIGKVRHAQGDYDISRRYLEKSLSIQQQIGDKAGEGTTLNDIAGVYDTQGECETAFKYLTQSLAISCEIDDKVGEAATIWNIGLIYKDQGKLAEAELSISRAIELEERIRHPKLEIHSRTLKAVRAKLREQSS